MKYASSVPLLTAIAVSAAGEPAHAYIDPGSTSMLLQVIVGGLAAVLVMTRRFWQGTIQRVRRFGRSHPGPPGQETARPAPTKSRD